MDDVLALSRIFVDGIGEVVDDIDIVAGAALQRVDAGGAIERIVALVAKQQRRSSRRPTDTEM